MESCWWVFKQLFDKEQVYQGFKVMPYSTVLTTALSNFEANQNYQDVTDPAVVVSFPLLDDPNTCLLAWTTTPWTLPSHLGLAVHPDFEYVKVADEKSGKVEKLQKEGYWGAAENLALHQRVLGKPMPKLELSNWIGKEVKPEDMKGRIIVIDYWATWCGPCIASIPHNNEVAKKYKDKQPDEKNFLESNPL